MEVSKQDWMEYDWSELFPPRIWKRGENYYHDDRVSNVHYCGRDTICAEVEGTETYTVSVTLEPGSGMIEDFYCTCPYGEDGTPCKHLAALLCALEDDILIDEGEKPEGENPSIEQCVNLLSEHQMRDLLIQFAQDNTYIREKIHLAAANSLPQTQKMQWKRDLDGMAEAAGDRHGFIRYEKAYHFCSSLTDYLEDRIPDLLIHGLTADAFDLTCLVFQTGLKYDMDDSDGGLTMVADACMDQWSNILELSDLKSQEEMFHWFAAQYSKDDLSEMFLEAYVFSAPWKAELAPRLLQMLDQQLQGCPDYRAGDLVVQRLRWMERSGTDKQEVDSFMAKHHHLPAVREIQFLQAMESHDYDAALALLEESKELDKDKAGLLAKSSTRKIEIFELTNRVSALKEELEYYIFTFRQDDLVYTEKLKALLTPTEWENLREHLLKSPSMRSQQYSLLAQEELYEQLMAQIEQSGDISAVERYDALLKEQFALRCRNVYVVHLAAAMDRASNRKAYWSVIHTLKKLYKYPDGSATAQALADSWKQKYPRRTSMLDELQKAGF